MDKSRDTMNRREFVGGTLAATGAIMLKVPKGFFPQQDTGLILGTLQASADTSFAEMSATSLALADIVARDPDVASVGMSLGAAAGLTENQGRIFASLKPRDARDASAFRIIERLRPFGGEIIQTSLSEDEEQRLRAALEPAATT